MKRNLSREQVRKSLRFSLLDGIFASGTTGFTQDYFTPFLLALGGTVGEVGILSALPNLFASVAQLGSADFAERMKSRRKIINAFVLLQALVLLPIAVIAFRGNANIGIFIALAVSFTAFGAVVLPPWGSLMSDLVPERKRGEYFGWRNKTLGFALVGASLLAGLILNTTKKFNVFYGFTIIFGLAFIFRLASWYFLTKMREPHQEHKREHYFTLIDFLARIRESNFAKFVLFVSLMSFSVNLAAPFFVVLMLRDLSFSYILYTLITITATLTIYFTMGRWGRHADKVGNLKVIRSTSYIIAVLPFLWVICRSPLYLFLIQVLAGFVWAGFNLCTSNFIYDAVTPAKRTRCIAYFNVLNGLAIGAGALTGGFLLQKLPPLFGYKILSLLVISFILRFLVSFFMLRHLKEVRPVEKITSNSLFFSMIGIRPLLGVDRRTIGYDGET
ncbi:MAG: MFS transporter [Candidatus Omnitrophica bacterium]|nr:MFS transporter [Candidatus Omnitrophota bacterium]